MASWTPRTIPTVFTFSFPLLKPRLNQKKPNGRVKREAKKRTRSSHATGHLKTRSFSCGGSPNKWKNRAYMRGTLYSCLSHDTRKREVSVVSRFSAQNMTNRTAWSMNEVQNTLVISCASWLRAICLLGIETAKSSPSSPNLLQADALSFCVGRLSNTCVWQSTDVFKT